MERAPIGVLGRLRERMTPLARLFVLLAAACVGVHFWTAARDGYLGWNLDLALPWTQQAVATLLPAAVLVWRPDARRSARPVLEGALVWTTFVALIYLLTSLLPWDLGERYDDGLRILSAAAVAASFVAPALIALGLEDTRHTRTAYPWPLVVIAGVLVAAMAADYAPTQIDWFNQQAQFVESMSWGYVALLAYLAQALLYPLLPLCLAILAWTSLSGARAREEGGRMWGLLCGGAVILLALHLYQWALGHLISLSEPPAFITASWYGWGLELIELAGWILLVGAFVVGAASGGPYDGEVEAGPASDASIPAITDGSSSEAPDSPSVDRAGTESSRPSALSNPLERQAVGSV
jgi:hypothetical protein